MAENPNNFSEEKTQALDEFPPEKKKQQALLIREGSELLRDSQESLTSRCLFLNNGVLVTGPTAHRWPRNHTCVGHSHGESLPDTWQNLLRGCRRLCFIIMIFPEIKGITH